MTPLQASIIALFNSVGIKSLSADQIAKELDITTDEVRKRGVAFWVCKGVLREQRVFKQIGTAGQRSTALLSNQDVDMVYTSVERLETKDGLLNSDEVIEASDL